MENPRSAPHFMAKSLLRFLHPIVVVEDFDGDIGVRALVTSAKHCGVGGVCDPRFSDEGAEYNGLHLLRFHGSTGPERVDLT